MEIFQSAAVFLINGAILIAGLAAQIPLFVGLGTFFSFLTVRGDST